MKETYRKGDSLETLKNGIYQDMNTAVILNQSTVLRTNEWQRGQHYPMFPPGYHRPVQNLLPIANLKQMSLGKTDYTWTNLNGIYSPQLSMVPIFSPSFTIKAPMSTSSQNQSHHDTQICMANTPQYSPTSTQSNIKRTMQQSFAPLDPTPFCKTANLVNPKITAGHRILPTTMADISPRVTQTVTKTTQGYQQSVIQNIGGYSINVPSSSAVKLTELSPYKEKPIPKIAQLKQQELLRTRKRSSSWPPGSEISKKKPKDGLTKDDQTIEEYQNLEMDVARILIRDIPFPVVSVGDKGSRVGMSFVGSGGGQETDKQAEMSAVGAGEILESRKQGSGSIPRSGEMHLPSRSAVESGGKMVPNEHESLWSEGIVDFNTHSTLVNVESTLVNVESTLLNVESTVMNVGNTEPEKQDTMSPSDRWFGEDPDKRATKSVAGDRESTASEKQEATPVVTKQTNISASERVEPKKEENRSNTGTEGIALMGSGESTKCNEQAKVSPLCSGQEAESEQQTTPLNTCCGGMQEPNKQANKPVQQDRVAPKKDAGNGETESRDSLHFENEKENYSKNTATPNKVVFTCEQCMVTFESTEDLISHTASHRSSNFTFKCNVCTQVFRSTNGLQKHIEFHEDHRNNFQCSFCFKPFSDRDSLEEHIIESHMSKRPHKCSYCPKAFRDPGSLQKHIRIHTGERPYKCTACEKSFAEYSSLRKHYRVHTGEQPYKCQYCSKAFSISGNLQRHILIHTGERPYKCSECSKTFNNPSHLRRHEKNLHSKLEREK